MLLKDFIKEFTSSADKKKTMMKHVKNSYIPFERKVAIATAIANKQIAPTGDLIKNTPMVYMSYVLSLVKEYTDIELSKDNSLADFNLLEQNGVTEYLILVAGKDGQSFDTVLQMVVGDTVDNHNNLVNQLNMKGDNIKFILDKVEDILKKANKISVAANKSGNVAQQY